jgi:hypothetical protein
MRKTANPPRSNYRCRATDQSSQSAGVKGSDPNGANLRADALRISNLWPSCVAKPRDCRTLRERNRAETAPGAACRSSFLPRKYLIGMDKRLKLAPFGSDPFIFTDPFIFRPLYRSRCRHLCGLWRGPISARSTT